MEFKLDDNSQEKKKINRVWLFTGLIIALVAFLWFFMSFLTPFQETYDKFSSFWHISVNDKVVYHGRISNYRFNHIHNNDVITFSTKKMINKNNTSLMVNVPFSAVKLYQNKKLTYTYHEKKKFVPMAVLEIPLSKSNEMQDLKIVVEPSINDPFTNIADFRLIKSGTLNETILKDSPQTLLLASFLILLGIILIALASSLIRTLYQVFAIGLYSLLGGIWILCCTKIIQVFLTNHFINTYAEFYSLYLSGIAFSLLQYSFIRDNKYRKKIYPMLIFMSCFSVFIIVFSYLNFFSIQAPLVIFQIFEAITNVVFIIALYLDSNWKTSKRIVALAFIVHFAFGILDVLRYNIERYLIANETHIGSTYTQYGLLVLIILMVYAFAIRNEEIIRVQIKETTWQEIAYTDSLTKLRNRTYFNEKISEIIHETNKYTIIYFDLNGLKFVNDNFSHVAGDMFILEFATFLKSHFNDANMIARMGGDEFIIVYNHCNQEKINGLFENFEEAEYKASHHKDYPLTSSYGIAYSFECNNDFSQVISLADHRMYCMKNKYYEAHENERRN